MDVASAKEVLGLIDGASALLHRALHLVRARVDDDEFASFRLSVGHVLAAVGERLTMPIYVSHPELTPEPLRDIVHAKRSKQAPVPRKRKQPTSRPKARPAVRVPGKKQ